MSEYVNRGILVEFHKDADSTSYAERVSFGSTSFFTIRASATISSVGATGLSTASADFTTPPWARGIEIYAAVSAVVSGTSGNASLSYNVKPKSLASNDYIAASSYIGGSVAGSTALFNGTTGDSYMTIYPGATAVTGGAVPVFSQPLPQVFRVESALAGSSASMTYGMVGRFIP